MGAIEIVVAEIAEIACRIVPAVHRLAIALAGGADLALRLGDAGLDGSALGLRESAGVELAAGAELQVGKRLDYGAIALAERAFAQGAQADLEQIERIVAVDGRPVGHRLRRRRAALAHQL